MRIVPTNHCPKCKIELDAVSDVQSFGSDHGSDEAPMPGDVTVCLYCTTPLEFTEDMTLKEIDIKSLPKEVQDILVSVVVGIQLNRTYH